LGKSAFALKADMSIPEEHASNGPILLQKSVDSTLSAGAEI
jgi:hypothetical protein